jgi:hypothetical protein
VGFNIAGIRNKVSDFFGDQTVADELLKEGPIANAITKAERRAAAERQSLEVKYSKLTDERERLKTGPLGVAMQRARDEQAAFEEQSKLRLAELRTAREQAERAFTLKASELDSTIAETKAELRKYPAPDVDAELGMLNTMLTRLHALMPARTPEGSDDTRQTEERWILDRGSRKAAVDAVLALVDELRDLRFRSSSPAAAVKGILQRAGRVTVKYGRDVRRAPTKSEEKMDDTNIAHREFEPAGEVIYSPSTDAFDVITAEAAPAR